MPQIRDIVAFDVPILLKLSEVLKELENFGDVTRISVDEKRRKTRDSMNIFVSFAESAGALRALNTEFIVIHGKKIHMGRNKAKIQKRNYGNLNNATQSFKKFQRGRDPSTDDEIKDQAPKSSTLQSRITHVRVQAP